MNIFVLDQDPIIAAQYHCDKHVVKMILESAQMLSTVLGAGYKPTHKNHPCTQWVAESKQNAEWLIALARALNEEYRLRYKSKNKNTNTNTNHKSIEVIKSIAWLSCALPNVGLTPFAQAMPEEYKNEDAVHAYRSYYRTKTFAEWRCGKPHWW